jgi:hypothetical protein
MSYRKNNSFHSSLKRPKDTCSLTNLGIPFFLEETQRMGGETEEAEGAKGLALGKGKETQ